VQEFKAGHAAHITDEVRRITGKAPIRFEQYAREFKSHWA
jgi:hypothetical protein